MKNLKRALCLALACVMLIGMMAVGTSATDFTDNDEIVNTDAVNTMGALNIINGKGDGSYFDPTGIVTRAEMAKMICVALNGGKDPQLGTDAYTFTDTAGHWAAGYIEYCTNVGIVSGNGDGTFAPNRTVTATEASKMLLVAIGYDAISESFVGASWAMKVNVKANMKGLYDELGVLNASAGLTRDNAAQMVYNAINAVKVEYDYKLVTGSDGNLTTIGVAQDVTTGKTTILADKFNMVSYKGVLKGVSYNKDTKKYTYTFSGGVAPDTVSIATTPTLAATTTDYTAFYGQYVKILYKDGTSEDTIYGMYDASGLTLKTTIGDLASVSSSTTKVSVKGTSYNVAATYGTVPGYVFTAGDSTLIAGAAQSIGALTPGTGGSYDKSSTVLLISSDSNTTIDYAVVIPATVAKVTYVSATAITAGTNYTIADHNVESGIVKDDYVTVVAAANSFQNPKATIAKATVVSGTIDGNKNTTSTNDILVSGTWYKLARNTGDAIELGEAYDVAIVGSYYYNLTKTSTGASLASVIYVSAAEDATTLNKVQAKAYFTDGTNAVINVSKYSTTGTANLATLTSTTFTGATPSTTASAVLSGKLYTYSVDSSGNYLLTEVNASNKISMNTIVSPGPTAFTAAASNVDAKLGSYTIADDAVIFVHDKDGYTVITGDAMNDWGALTLVSSLVVTKNVNGLPVVKIAFADVGTTTSAPSGTAGNYGYITSVPYSMKDGTNTYKTFTMWNGSASVTVIDKGSTTVAKGNIVTYTDKGSGYVEVTNATDALPAAIVGFSDKSLSFSDSNGVVIPHNRATKTVYMYIDTKNVAGVSSGEIAVADTDTNGSRFQNAYYISTGITTSDLKLVVYEVNNKFENATTTYLYSSTNGYAVTTPDVTVALNGLTATVEADRAYALNGDTVTVTVTVAGTANAAGTINVSGVAAATVTAGTLTNATVNATTGMTVTGAGATNGTFTYTYVMGAGASAPTVGILPATYAVAAPTIVAAGITATYPASAFSVVADKTFAADNEVITFTVTYNGAVTDADDTFTFVPSATSGADTYVAASGVELTDIIPGETWTCSMAVNAGPVVAPIITVTSTVNP